ncbi:MAG: GNAT family N-acetyltransferase [Bacteroidetes bacterium]|nr:GNAT family N-acetyltransferase [Bacteroidota bacterium]
MQIRRATIEDATALSKLASKTFFDTFTGTCTDADMDSFLQEYYNINQVIKELSDSKDYYYLYDVDAKAVGYIRVKEDYSGFDELKNFKSLELKRLYVLKEFHGLGVAQQLMDFAFDFANKNKYTVMWLGVWEYNERAKRFYAKNGFIDTCYSHPFPIGNTPQTDLWYWKKL